MTKQQCIHCSKTFQITDSDQAFYTKLSVPAPVLCPDCRMQRRLAWRNERYFYQRTCDLTGKPIVSIYSPNSPIQKVYERDAWFGDGWDALEYGRDFDFSRPFFEQFAEMMYEIPHIALWNWDCENSDYNHCCYQLKNSYMNSCTDKSEDSYYSYLCINNRSVADCTSVEHSELAIECIDSDNLYSCAYNQQCRNCMNTYLSFDCTGCKYVFGCTGLRNKEYYIFNKPVTKEEWERTVPELLGNHSKLQAALAKAYDVSLPVPRLYNAIFNSENCTGNYVWNSKNAENSFDCRGSENVKYITYAPWNVKDSMDGYALGDGELLYDANFGGAPVYNTQFTLWLKNGPHNSQYNILCVNGCDNVFGSVGLKAKQYCILNKQYTKAEYEQLRDKIIDHMKQTGEYGQLFPTEYSPFGYNETVAHEYYPLSKDDAQRFNWRWQDDTGGTFGRETLKTIPEDIHQITETISKETLACSNCQRNFRFVQPELQLYKQIGVALPRECPNCRHLRKIKLRNPRRLWQRQCMCTQTQHSHQGRCIAEFETTYDPERKELIYCKDCYAKETY